MYATALTGLRRIAGLVLLAWLLTGGSGLAGPAGGGVLVLRVDGAIGPATVAYLQHGLARAASSGAALVVIEMDTPGGLDSSMRLIIQDILASPVPVATFVAPEGARAASAGTYILYASHVAAMAPATNLGAATPVAIGIGGAAPGGPEGGPARPPEGKPDDKPAAPAARPLAGSEAMSAKVLADASAYIRSLAQLRGRNADFAERAVREAASLSAEEALKQGVVEVVAADLPELLVKLNGRQVALGSGTVILQTSPASVTHLAPDWRNRLLALLANPQVALLLMMIGIYGLFFEFTTPGFGVPGVAGAISLLLALYAFQLLPVNWAGVALLGIGTGLMLAEAFVPSFGALGVGGVVAFVVGGLFLMDTEAPGFGLPLPLIFGLAFASLAILLLIGGLAARSHRRPVVSGREDMAGVVATVGAPAGDGSWWVTVRGETWRARSTAPLAPGMQVTVQRLDGLTLEVSPRTDSSMTGSTRS